MMGNVIFQINDNASGVSSLLNLASFFAKSTNQNIILFLFVLVQKVRLAGSKYFTSENPLIEFKI